MAPLPVSSASSVEDEGDHSEASDWLHVYGSDEHVLKALREVLHVSTEDVAIVLEGNVGPQAKFVEGTREELDYLFIVAHELRLEPSTPSISEETSASDELQLIEIQLSLFFFPELRLLVTFGDTNCENAITEVEDLLPPPTVFFLSSLLPAFPTFLLLAQSKRHVKAAQANLRNRRSLLRRDCKERRGIPTLIVVLLDAILDQVAAALRLEELGVTQVAQMFPILNMYGDAMEGLALFVARDPSHEHVQLSNKLKTRVRQIRACTWDARSLFIELSQDMCGCLESSERFDTLIQRWLKDLRREGVEQGLTIGDSTMQIEKEAQSLIDLCVGIETFYTSFQNARMNKTLYALTVATICMMPFQCLTGLFGMNFKNMPELEWDHGYLMFWCIAGLQITLAVCILIYSQRTGHSGPVIVLDEQRLVGGDGRPRVGMSGSKEGESSFLGLRIEPLARIMSGKSAIFRTGRVESVG
ncbi:hypothetical protein GUITHDRAFT_99436 [Guillardia theta CCMP2712]|uniref:Uncharacterized protein n=1 Tax=Guillardia theta (strain CCMP2712) TaxID=905079 RepID=L1K2Y3_GUITC|nr:hypothetical protein GUITHDRAFT_99436 [Guillardia theta CCMP2712]EKX54785.1 hypothetical protein GUITHDRAFT_99436 [Guillardia theta CCMP2712]|eukprot:XP_005841765.1 hypothetical protein GUITHDRAFT_99436 [Guillardia theta CCMP2712]